MIYALIYALLSIAVSSIVLVSSQCMVARSSRKVMTCEVETMVICSNPLWVLVRPSVKRATPQSKNALRIRTTVNTRVGTVFRVVWYTSAIQESVLQTLDLIAMCCTEKYKINLLVFLKRDELYEFQRDISGIFLFCRSSKFSSDSFYYVVQYFQVLLANTE